ncbi:MAG: hypothetical protein FWB97_09950 [Oscillospiraceae bacterium]|nr:hypothetical protein [Oscillospiraceae bacterium]
MDINTRNEYMVNHDYMIKSAMRRNKLLIKALRLDPDDVYQELAIAMLKAVDCFDPSRSASLDACVNAKLKYAILDLKRKHKPGGLTGIKAQQVSVISFESYYEDGNPLQIPVYDSKGDTELSDAFATLTAPEQETMRQRMDGHSPSTRAQRDLLASASGKIRSFYNKGGLLPAS